MAEREIVARVGARRLVPPAGADLPAGRAALSIGEPGQSSGNPGPSPGKPRLSPGKGHGRRAADFVGGVLAMLLLPLSIAPVLLLGPSVLRAPVALAHEGWGDVQRLEHRLDPEHPYRRPLPTSPGPSVWQTQVSLGSIYGRWSELPGAGQAGVTWTGTR
jgi:hypothetical protein